MPTEGSELLALALALEADGVGDEEAVATLVASAEWSATALMGAYAYALCLARDMPFDTSNDRTLGLLTKSLQRAVREGGNHRTAEGTPLLEHIVEVSGRASVAPGAVASRTAEVEADLDSLRAPDEGGSP